MQLKVWAVIFIEHDNIVAFTVELQWHITYLECCLLQKHMHLFNCFEEIYALQKSMKNTDIQ